MSDYEPTHGSLVHVELYSDDVEATREFYQTAFDWAIEPVEDVDGMDYLMWRAPNPPNGGLMAADDLPFDGPATLFYVQVDDLATAQAAIAKAGGEIVIDETAVPEMGSFAVFRDPGDVIEAIWEERYEGEVPEEGFPMPTDAPEAGSIVHFELYSDDAEATRAFHESVFGWEIESVGADAYTTVETPTPPYGGLVDAGPEMSAGTLAYLLVDDAEVGANAVREAGGRITREPFEIDGAGTMAVFEAPGGIVQALWESDAAAGRQAPDSPEGEAIGH